MQTKPNRTTSKIPFVGLHAHSTFSPFDGLGLPGEHMDFAYENGMAAHSLTDHGTMAGTSYQIEHLKQMRGEGKEFKAIYGCETYFIQSHRKWRVMHEEHQATIKQRKKEEYKMVVEEENKSGRKFNPLNSRAHLVIVAQNQVGLNNLFQLVSDSYRPENFYRYPRMDFEMLEKYNEGLIVSSACLSGIFAHEYWANRGKSPEHVLEAMRIIATRFKAIFGDRFYGEIQWNAIPEQHELNDYVIQVCIELGIEVISTADSHYPRPEMWKDREMYKRLGWAGKSPAWGDDANSLPESVDAIGYELYPKNGDQMWESYKRYSAKSKIDYEDDYVLNSITRTHVIATERIEDFSPDTTIRLPEFVIPEGKTAIQALTEMAIVGLKDKGLHTNEEYVARLKHELDVIDSRGFAQYFLTMKAISDKAQEQQLTGVARGSAAGSILAYVLKITQIDPIKYKLQFERFLTKGSTGMPDIDFDLSNRDEIIQVLQDDWGQTTVVPISNFNMLQLKSLIKDLGKFYKIPFTEVNRVTQAMMEEATPRAKEALGLTAGLYVPNFEEVKEHSETLQVFFREYPQVATHVDKLLGNVRSCSKHAGGVVIAENLDRYMPLINSGGVVQTPWCEGQNVRHLEPLGFIKFDLLGLGTLRMISGAIRHILKRHHNIPDPSFGQVKEFYDKNLHPDVMDFDDQSVWEGVFHEGRWAGVFQMTNGGAQKFCQEAKPVNLTEFSAVTSIYRPGPLAAGVHKMYVANRGNPNQVRYEHPIIKEVMGETYGLLCFQEQIASLAHAIGDELSLDEGNMLRKLLTKKGTGKEDLLGGIHKKFMTGGNKKGFTDNQLKDLWAKMELFNKYGFCRGHAMAYSAISYQCAWLLHYYEPEWLASWMDAEPEKKKMSAINTVKSFGYEIVSPSVNRSGRVWEISEDGKTLIQPLTGIKGLGDKAVDQIIMNRPFLTVEDFLFSETVVYSKLNKKTLDVLVRSQALDELMDDRFTGMKHFWSSVAVDRPRKEKNLLENIELYAPEGDFSPEERVENFASLTGIFPLHEIMSTELQQSLKSRGCPPVSEHDPDLKLVWFVPREVIQKKTKNGKEYWIIKTTDSNSFDANIRCWGVKDTDRISLNKVYVANLEHNEKWGFSTRSISRNFRRLS